jgi:hypothetical protein
MYEVPQPRRRSLAVFASNSTYRLAMGIGVGAVFGHLMSAIPSPTIAHVFWVGNVCAPWLALSFLSGVLQKRLGFAILAGILTDLACVVGFYWNFLFLGPVALGMPASTPLPAWIFRSFIAWVTFIGPWAAIAIGSGAIYGVLGRWWRRSGTTAATIAVALPFLAEPPLWTFQGDQVPLLFWIAETIAGIVIGAFLIRRRSWASDTN